MMQDIKEIVKITTDEKSPSFKCKSCSKFIGSDKFQESVNHYIQEHEYKLLHIGSETAERAEGGLYYSTVAILGK